MKITFLGAVEEVTGSKYLLEHEQTTLLVDCGLFQGSYHLTKRNWDAFFQNPARINALVLTHAHIDHTGYIPLLVKKGFKGKIYCSQATYELCSILLLDNGHLEEEAAARYNEQKDANTPVQQPLYTAADAQNALQFFKVVEEGKPFGIKDFTVTLIRCSHILGSSFVIVSDGKTTLSFSGDLGSPKQLIMKSPEFLTQTDYLVLESTYGARVHKEGDAISMLGKIIQATIERNGVTLIPAFAVGRTQTILYCLYQLQQQKIIQNIPIYLDSPMAIKVTELFCDFPEDYSLSASACKEILSIATPIPTTEDSKRLNNLSGPAIIIAGSGMMNGGRMMHHLPAYISDPKNTIILVGYQSETTLGHALAQGTKKIFLFGQEYEVNAKIKSLDLFSAHADSQEILDWLAHFEHAPKITFLTHGDLPSAQALKSKIEHRFGWEVVIPHYQQSFELD